MRLNLHRGDKWFLVQSDKVRRAGRYLGDRTLRRAGGCNFEKLSAYKCGITARFYSWFACAKHIECVYRGAAAYIISGLSTCRVFGILYPAAYAIAI